MKGIISTDNAPKAQGPYSQAVKASGLIFVAGQIPIDPETGELVAGGIAAQTERVIRNVEAIVKAAGSDLSRVVKTTVYLADINDFAQMNEVYSRFFAENPPARTTIQAARLPRDVLVEIDAIALA